MAEVKKEHINRLIADSIKHRIHLAADEEVELAKKRMDNRLKEICADVSVDLQEHAEIAELRRNVNIQININKY